MSDPETFFTRWSRRKQAAVTKTDETKSSAVSSAEDSEFASASERMAGAERQDRDHAALPGATPQSVSPPFDPLSVPPIEAITADTDIRGFLTPGVPLELTRAALRRAWVADPKIRDFVGLADYAWDFNAPGSMAGFGSLEMTDELRRLAARIIGPAPTQDQTTGTPHQASASMISEQDLTEPEHRAPMRRIGPADDRIGIAPQSPAAEPAASCGADDLSHRDQPGGTTQHQSCTPENSQLIVRTGHGGALPK
jgi:hypothetical protein